MAKKEKKPKADETSKPQDEGKTTTSKEEQNPIPKKDAHSLPPRHRFNEDGGTKRGGL